MATLRTTTGSLLGTVTDTANTISTLANTISGGVNILNDMVQSTRTKRNEANTVEMISFRDNLFNDASLDAVKREETIRAYIGNDELKQDSFKKFYTKLTSAFEKSDKENSENQE